MKDRLYAAIILAVFGMFGASAFAAAPTLTGTGDANLQWGKPTLNENGTPLTNLAKYRIHYGAPRATACVAPTDYVGSNAGSLATGGKCAYANVVDVTDPALTSRTLTLTLNQGTTTVAFAMTAVNSVVDTASPNGQTSIYSGEVKKTFTITVVQPIPNPPTSILVNFNGFTCVPSDPNYTCTFTAN